MRKDLLTMLLIGLVAFVGIGCGDDDDDEHDHDHDGGAGDADGDSDSDSDGDSDADSDSDGDTDPVEECEDGVCFVSGVFTDDQHWTTDYQYVLRGGVFIGDDVNETVLTIDPGVEIFGEAATKGMLVITRNSKIMAEGTATAPIVMSSSKNVGDRARGDWGGVIINGNAVINGCDDPPCEGFGEGGTGYYGGDDNADSSGTFSYVRIEFAGHQISPDNELNGLACQGVGSGTTIDHVQIHRNADDAIEFFGGTAQWKYVIATATGDDNLDWTDGWQGKGQFFVAKQLGDDGDQGIEADNNGEDNTATPYSNPTISNVTLYGSNTEKSDIGMLLREGTKGTLHCVIAANFEDHCLNVDHDQTWLNVDDGSLSLNHSILNCTTSWEDDDDGHSVENDFFNAGTGNSVADPNLADPDNDDFAPGAGPAIGNCTVPAGAFFDDVDFIGGVDPDDNWVVDGISDGWIALPEN